MMDLRRVLLVVWVLVLPVVAKAEIVHRVPENPGAGQFDLNADGATDFVFLHSIACLLSEPPHCFHHLVVRGPFSPGHSNGILVDGASVGFVPQGTAIGDVVEGFDWGHSFLATSIDGVQFDYDIGNLPRSPASAILGARFEAEDGFHYGWVRLGLEAWDPIDEAPPIFDIFNNPGDIVDWGYESTPNTPIVAGAVPEPAAWLLVIVSAAIVVGWKLRRRVLPFVICVLSVPVAANGEIIYRSAARPGSWEAFDLDGNGEFDYGFGVEAKVTGPDQLSI
jgi:hypothetical protein